MAKLTLKQQRFVEEYTVDFNATKAAERAGYSIHTAAAIGCENLTKPNIKSAIDQRVQILTMSANEALIRMSDFARGSMKPFMLVDQDNTMIVELSSEEAQRNLHLIREVKQHKSYFEGSVTGITTEIKLHDAKDATAKVLQMHGKLIDKKQIDLTSDGEPVEKTMIVFGKGSHGKPETDGNK